MELQPINAYKITVGGDISEISPKNGKTFELEKEQARHSIQTRL